VRPTKDVIMHAKTPAVAALAGTALALPTAALAADPPTPKALRPPVAGHRTVVGQMRDAHWSTEATRLARRLARVRKREFHDAHFRAKLRRDDTRALRARAKRLRAELTRARRAPASGAVSAPGYLQAIAACESGGNPAANTGNGFYGKYQFTQSTWQSVGGTGNPAAAPEAEQDRRAAMLYAQQGSTPWPVCGR
jgi:Transglycosylase-like domain